MKITTLVICMTISSALVAASALPAFAGIMNGKPGGGRNQAHYGTPHHGAKVKHVTPKAKQ